MAAAMTDAWSSPLPDLLAALDATPEGLSPAQADQRRREHGPNRLTPSRRAGALRLLARQYRSPLVLILVFGAVISAVVRDWTDAGIIMAIVLGSTLMGFFQEYRASQAVAALRAKLALRTTARRAGKPVTIAAEDLVPGDVVELSAGNLVPADGRVITARDFLVSQAALTGETFPVEKSPEPVAADAALAGRTNMVFLGTSVQSGTARVLITRTGGDTEIGQIAGHVADANGDTEFQRGIRGFGYLLTEVMTGIVIFVFTVNLLLHRPVIESLLFSVALAVGLSPELLPAIVSITLAAGARGMAQRGVIVRRLEAIENLGSVDVLCTDKTGTLTKGVVEFNAALDPSGAESAAVFGLAAVNARLESGIANPLDAAIVKAAEQRACPCPGGAKVDEIPYDFVRKRLTIVVEEEARHLMVTKGAFEPVLECCRTVASPSGPLPLDAVARERLEAFFRARGEEGFRVLGLASRRLAPQARYGRADEAGMVFEGFLLFFDPLKEGIEETVREIEKLGIAVKILTGDNRHVAAHVAAAVGLDTRRVITGRQMNEMRDEALWHLAEHTALFAELDPQQKERIIRALQHRGHAVAYLGDGVNDAPALHVADAGVSVDQAVDVARETADIVLLQQDLNVLRQGVVDGRRTFANTLKYISIATSGNFGNMVSMAFASVAVPFLPLLAKQILLNNFLSDIPAMAISTDNVDEDALKAPQRWNIRAIGIFMLVFGLSSTLFDFLTFALLLLVFHADEALFQSTWFTLSVVTELAVMLVLRTHMPFWRSRPSPFLMGAVALVAVVTIALPFIAPLARAFGFVPLPASLLALGAGIAVLYVAGVEITKKLFYSGAHVWHRQHQAKSFRKRQLFRPR